MKTKLAPATKKAFKFFGFLIIALLIYYFFYERNKNTASDNKNKTEEPVSYFVKEGELTFIKSDSSTLKINIEVAESEDEQVKGLMYRNTMKDTEGMLFVYFDEAPRSFWMKNTYISLDIIFTDANGKIISIAKNVEPLSKKSIKSEGNAQYVLEVNAGFCIKNNIKTGDKIEFVRLDK